MQTAVPVSRQCFLKNQCHFCVIATTSFWCIYLHILYKLDIYKQKSIKYMKYKFCCLFVRLHDFNSILISNWSLSWCFVHLISFPGYLFTSSYLFLHYLSFFCTFLLKQKLYLKFHQSLIYQKKLLCTSKQKRTVDLRCGVIITTSHSNISSNTSNASHALSCNKITLPLKMHAKFMYIHR